MANKFKLQPECFEKKFIRAIHEDKNLAPKKFKNQYYKHF